MLPSKRLSELEKLVSCTSQLSINKLAESFDVSYSTIYRDLASLRDKYNFMIKNHHVIVAPSKERLLSAEKSSDPLILKALDMVSPDDSIFIAPGCTCSLFAEVLAKKVALRDVNVVTNNIHAAGILAPHISNLYTIGGEVFLYQDRRYTGGVRFSENLKEICVNKVFMSVDGLNEEYMSVDDLQILFVLENLLQLPAKKILIAQKNVEKNRAMHLLASVSKVDSIIR